jgi:hypothetical protein
MTTASRRSLFVLGLLAVTALAGCDSQEREPLTRHEQILDNLTPELRTLYMRDIDVVNTMAHTDNTNLRAMHGDLLRAFYRDRPSRLHPAPSPY